MPRRSKGPRLWLRPERRRNGRVVARATWIIIHGSKHIATRCAADQAEQAQLCLAAYLADQYQPQRKERDIERIDVADVLSIYYDDRRDHQANQKKLDERIGRLNEFWGGKMLSEVNGALCRAYVQERGSPGGARRDLEDLRAAINYHAKQNLHRGAVHVVLPPKGPRRERWLTRSEAARLLWACWRARELQTIHRGPRKGQTIETSKRPLRHVARFILLGLYTGTRAGAIAAASPHQAEGRSHVDLDRGIFYRRAQGRKATNKRQPPVPIPPRLLAHLRRWHERGIASDHFVEWQGKPVHSVKTGFARAVELAKIPGKVTPHTLRHTAATWLLQAGVPLWQAAGFLGMSPKLLEEVYGHHHPDHLRDAALGISYGRPGRAPRRDTPEKLVVSLAEERAKRDEARQALENIGGPGRIRTCNQTVMSGRL